MPMSINIDRHYPLQALNTFGLDVHAERFCRFHDVESLKEALEASQGLPRLILGGGSNVLFTSDFQGTVLKNEVKGITQIYQDGSCVRLEVGAGEVWHDLVLHTVKHGWGGLENMSLIPGSCGAAPMQNIGAYGVEMKDTFLKLKAYHIQSGEVHEFTKEQCEFGYRESVFKRKLKGQYVILSITVQVSKDPVLNTSYGAIEQELEAMDKEPTVQTVSEAVIRIRQSKLPDPAVIGNAGSFFKNPVIDATLFDKIIQAHPDMPHYPAPEGHKLAAGWLIEQCGWKGKDLGGYGVHDRQALVLVNRGQATGKAIYALSEEIIRSVKGQFGVDLEREVNIV